jgi:endonuclease/exonuclease/phosphatase family metal-dependent hydrolase
MSEGNVIKFTLFLSLLFISFTCVFPQDNGESTIRVMFYNVENLFDTYNDTLKDDDEFLPDGLRRWTYGRYNRKISSIFKTIVAAGEWYPPALVAFCEVENRKVLEDLVYGTYLSKYDYGIIHEDSPDPRGIDVCMIYRKDRIEIIDYRYMVPPSTLKTGFTSRSVLYAECVILSDTIHFFINHWPSRRGGVLAGEDQRRMIAEMVRHEADSIANSSGGKARIILMGDFNATPDDVALSLLTRKYNSGATMVNMSAGAAELSGTYRYMGTWETIDQVIVSDMLLSCSTGLSTKPGLFRVFRPGFLLKTDPKYPGVSPFSTYSGYSYQGGYSDHLPVLIDLFRK